MTVYGTGDRGFQNALERMQAPFVAWRRSWRRMRRGMTLIGLLLIILACSTSHPSSFKLSIVHLNDTHSHLEQASVNLTIDGEMTTAQIGGFPRIKAALDELRRLHPNLLLLHGGDAVQGTLYFDLFNGAVEFDFLNLLDVDAMTFGNHEFDRGPGPIEGWIRRSRFPWLSANIDFTGEPAIDALIKPCLIKEIRGEKVAIIGVTTEDTPKISRDVGKTVFKDPVKAARRQVEALSALGINKIILLSHLGYERDKALAAEVSGIDVIIGGHSHSLLGDTERLAAIGLKPQGPYPTELKAPDGSRVLVLQAWQWGHVLGDVHVHFTPSGEVATYSAGMTIPLGHEFVQNNTIVSPDSDTYLHILRTLQGTGIVRITAEDPQVKEQLAPYARLVAAYRFVAVARTIDDLIRGLNSGPGPLVADSMLAAVPHAQVALLNNGGVRKDLHAGTISVADVLEVLPFDNTLVLLDLTGEQLYRALEEGIDYLLRHYPKQDPPAMPYLAGARFSVRPSVAMGGRVSALEVKDDKGVYQPVQTGTVYRTVITTFLSNGGDGFATLKEASGYRSDTGTEDSDAFRDYLERLGTVQNPTEQRITILH